MKRPPRPHRDTHPWPLIAALRPFAVAFALGGPLLALFGLVSLGASDDALRLVLSLGALIGGTGCGVIAVIWLVENRRH